MDEELPKSMKKSSYKDTLTGIQHGVYENAIYRDRTKAEEVDNDFEDT